MADEIEPIAGPSGLNRRLSYEGSPNNKKQTVLDLVQEAIEQIGVPRKGATAQAIKKYVRSISKMEDNRLNAAINKALRVGLEKEIFARPRDSNAVGAAGRFVLVKKKSAAKNTATKKTAAKKLANKNPASEIQDAEENGSDSETAPEKPKKARKKKLIPAEEALDQTYEVEPKTAKSTAEDLKEKGESKPSKPKPEKAKSGKAKPAKAKPAKAQPAKAQPAKEKLAKEKPAKEKSEKAKEALVKTTKRTKVKTQTVTVERGDASDSELVINKKRKSMKSYSSDTEVNLIAQENARDARNAKSQKVKGTKKLYKTENVEKETVKKNVRAKKA